ncbi:MAG: hypothetical protein V3T24_03695, partial [Longimicrobiales bacterium]
GDVHAFLDGALGAYPEEAATHVREHLEVCQECARLLEDEKRLRAEASKILAASAQTPVELDPLEELLARAAALGGQSGAEEAGAAEGARARPSLGRRIYSLRWAATVVVSLGAGWMARGLSGPAGSVAPGFVAEPAVGERVRPVATEIGARVSADQELQERDNAGRLAEAETLPDSPNAVAVGGVAPDADPGAGGFDDDRGAGRPDADPGAGGFDDDAVLDKVEAVPDRQRVQSAVVRELGPTDANVIGQPTEPQVEALSLSDELRSPAQAVERRDRASVFSNAAPARSAQASRSTTPFMVPGLPVRDVRVAPSSDGPPGEPGGSVIVTQELADGRIVELEFVPLTANDPGPRGFQERSEPFGRARQAGWSMVVRDVPGGVAVLSGPLTEPELAELLDRALGLR